MAEQNDKPTTTQYLNMLHDQIDTMDRCIKYCDVKFIYEDTYTFYRMNMN